MTGVTAVATGAGRAVAGASASDGSSVAWRRGGFASAESRVTVSTPGAIGAAGMAAIAGKTVPPSLRVAAKATGAAGTAKRGNCLASMTGVGADAATGGAVATTPGAVGAFRIDRASVIEGAVPTSDTTPAGFWDGAPFVDDGDAGARGVGNEIDAIRFGSLGTGVAIMVAGTGGGAVAFASSSVATSALRPGTVDLPPATPRSDLTDVASTSVASPVVDRALAGGVAFGITAVAVGRAAARPTGSGAVVTGVLPAIRIDGIEKSSGDSATTGNFAPLDGKEMQSVVISGPSRPAISGAKPAPPPALGLTGGRSRRPGRGETVIMPTVISKVHAELRGARARCPPARGPRR